MNRLSTLPLIFLAFTHRTAFAGIGDTYVLEPGNEGPFAFLIPFIIIGVLVIAFINYIKEEFPSKAKIDARDKRLKILAQAQNEANDKQIKEVFQRETDKKSALEAELLAATTFEQFLLLDFDAQWRVIQKEGTATMVHFKGNEEIATIYYINSGFLVENFYNSGSPSLIPMTDWSHIKEDHEYVTIQDHPNSYDYDY